jgi:diguanylate cyclase (GGDEF)-like protein
LSVFADQAAIAISNARLFDSAHRRAEEMSSLYHIGLTLTAGLDMEQVLVALCDQVRLILPVDVFYVSTFDEETMIIELPLYYEDGTFLKVEPRSMLSSPGITGEVIRSRKTIYLPDVDLPDIVEKYHILRRSGQPSRSYVGVPLVVLDRVVGVVSMQSFQPNAYTPEQIRLLETIATQASIATHNARLYDQMKQMAITDPVTQLFTRRHFTFLGSSEVERALRYNRSLSVLMIDIDHFKKVNDTYGHSTGDSILHGVAKTCRAAMRATDIIGRWGGEEFVIVLPEADMDGAALIAERIRRMVAQSAITVGQHQILVTVSIGLAVLGDCCCSLDVLIDQADRAMYLAKADGRNKVHVIKE